MELTWLDPDSVADHDAAGAAALLEAARAVDAPHELGPTVTSVLVDLRHGWDGVPTAAALARDGRGRVVGLLTVELPHWDNTHLGYVNVTVDPVARRCGLGRRLFAAGVDRIRAEGRSLVLADCWDAPALVGFVKAMGLDRAAEEAQRRQDLLALDWRRLDREDTAVAGRSPGYELVRLAGAVPEDLLADVARLTEAINDAPTDDLDVEDEVYPTERLRAFETAQRAHGRRVYRLVARERSSGALAGQTLVAVEGERPGFGQQYDTSVARAHRGHGLGLRLKIAMLRWLAEEEPQLRTLDTWNAASNAHMIRVNEILGYRVVATAIEWQRHL